MRSYWKDALVILRRESKFGLLFPGQGSSIYEGMTRQLELTFPHIVKPILTKASQLLIDFPLVPAVLLQQGSLQKLIPTEIAQPAIFLTSYIHYQCLKVKCILLSSIRNYFWSVLLQYFCLL